MSLEVLSTIFAGLTFAVIAATAIAAMVQLRHLRASNQLNAMLTTLEMWKDPQFQEYYNFVRIELEQRLKDREFFGDYQKPLIDRSKHPELNVCDAWEQIGSYLKYGLIDERAVMDVSCSTIAQTWRGLWPVIKEMRKTRGPALFENFEYAAVKGILWMRSHPGGNYPKGLPRVTDLEPDMSA